MGVFENSASASSIPLIALSARQAASRAGCAECHAAPSVGGTSPAINPQVTTANQVGELVQELQEFREDLSDVIARAEAMHEDPAGQADLLTSEGADTMAEVRKVCDALELSVSDECWPLPKYREMLFPV